VSYQSEFFRCRANGIRHFNAAPDTRFSSGHKSASPADGI
jgi:hypothetical protein